MNSTTAAFAIGVLVVIALTGVAVFLIRRFNGSAKIDLNLRNGTLKAKGKNPTPQASLPSSVKITGAEGHTIRAYSSAEGGIEMKDVKADGGAVEGTHTPETGRPKE